MIGELEILLLPAGFALDSISSQSSDNSFTSQSSHSSPSSQSLSSHSSASSHSSRSSASTSSDSSSSVEVPTVLDAINEINRITTPRPRPTLPTIMVERVGGRIIEVLDHEPDAATYRNEYYYNAVLNILFKKKWQVRRPKDGILLAAWQPVSQ